MIVEAAAGIVAGGRRTARFWLGCLAGMAAVAALADFEPLAYLFAWAILPGRWIALLPQGLGLVSGIVAAGMAASLLTGAAAVGGAFAIPYASVRSGLILWMAALLGGTGFGFGLAWVAYMFLWKPF